MTYGCIAGRLKQGWRIACKLKTKINKSKPKLWQVKPGKYAVPEQLPPLKITNHKLTLITEQQSWTESRR